MPEHLGGDRAPEIVRYGPGVPAALPVGRAELTAERIWHNPGPAKPSGRRTRLGALFGWALVVYCSQLPVVTRVRAPPEGGGRLSPCCRRPRARA
jgi:hypothetical protein